MMVHIRPRRIVEALTALLILVVLLAAAKYGEKAEAMPLRPASLTVPAQELSGNLEVPLQSSRAIEIRHGGGLITVHEHDGNDLQLAWSATTSSSRPTELVVTEPTIECHVQDGVCHIDSAIPGQSGNTHVQYNLDVLVPAGCDVTVRNRKGGVIIEGAQGNIRAEALEGKIQLTDVSGAITAEASGGAIEVRYAESVPVAAIACRTLDGPIHLEIPEDHAFDLTVDVLHGHFTSDFPVMINGGLRQPRFTAHIAGGGTPVHIDTLAGDITLKHL